MAEPLLDHAVMDGQLDDLLAASRWIVGFSGGVDSTVLLHLLQRWCQAHRGAPPLTAIHVNHGMQPAARDWQGHCEQLCKYLQVPLVSAAVTVPGGSEAAARTARYQAFEAQLAPGEVLFLGHHLDDQVETFFLRLMRGAGVQGLAAIPARRALGDAILARPLLQTARAELEHYAAQHGLECVQDPSNNDTAMDRNFLRAQLLPLLASRWPGYRSTVTRAAAHMSGAVTALQQALPAPPTVHSSMGDAGIALAALVDVPASSAALILRNWLQAAAYPAPDQSALDEFLRQLQSAAGDANPRLECSAYTLQRYRDAVYLLPDPGGPPCSEPLTLSPGEACEVPGVGTIRLEQVATQGLLLAEGERLELAWRVGGERCQPRGRGGSNSLKKLLQERAIPPWWRDRMPLLYLGGELLAVGDLWLCESSRWRESAAPGECLWVMCWQRDTGEAYD